MKALTPPSGDIRLHKRYAMTGEYPKSIDCGCEQLSSANRGVGGDTPNGKMLSDAERSVKRGSRKD